MGHQRTLFRVPRPNRDPKNEDLAAHGSVRLVFGTPICTTARSAPLEKGGGRQFLEWAAGARFWSVRQALFGVCGRNVLECAAGTFWNVRQVLFGVGSSTKKRGLASQRPRVAQEKSKLGQPSVGSGPGLAENVLAPGVGNVGMTKGHFSGP